LCYASTSCFWVIAGPLFLNPTASNTEHRWLPTAIKREWERACKAAGVPVTSSYEGTKHSTATQWLASGVSLETIKALLGHRDIQSTAIYARVHELSMVRAVTRCRRRFLVSPNYLLLQVKMVEPVGTAPELMHHNYLIFITICNTNEWP